MEGDVRQAIAEGAKQECEVPYEPAESLQSQYSSSRWSFLETLSLTAGSEQGASFSAQEAWMLEVGVPLRRAQRNCLRKELTDDILVQAVKRVVCAVASECRVRCCRRTKCFGFVSTLA